MNNEQIKAYINRKCPLRRGYERTFYVCKQCRKMTYVDSENLPLSAPVVTTPCGHSFQHSYVAA